MPQPNFFLVGAPKAGTTSLYHALRQHPDIYMSPIKEPCYFSAEVRPENFTPDLRPLALRIERSTLDYLHGPMDKPRSGGIVRDWDDYQRLFSGARDQRAIGEASVGYMVSPHAAGAIAQRIPHAKLIMVLRSPADRAFSHYLHCVSDGLIHCSFRDYVRTCLRHTGEGLGIHRPFLEMGFYAEQVKRFIEHFPINQIGVWIYEETLHDARTFLRQIFRFLEVGDQFEPHTAMRHNEPRIPRFMAASKPLRQLRMTTFCREVLPAPVRTALRRTFYRPNRMVAIDSADRAMMLGLYRSDIHALEEILHRDLNLWLKEDGTSNARAEAAQ